MPLPPAPLLIVGAGYLGARVAEGWVGLGGQVVACTRSGARVSELPGVSAARLDIVGDPPDRLRALAAGASAVLLSYSSGGGQQDRRTLFLDGGRRILAALEGLPLARVVYCSSTSALPELDALLDESCSAWPTHERGRVQREAEERMCEGLQRLGCPWFVLRLAGLYGPGRELGRLYLRAPASPLAGDGERTTNLVHRDDAVAVVLAALRADPSIRGLVNVCDDDHCSRREMVEALARRDGLPSPRWLGTAVDPPRPSGKRVDNRRMKQWFGVRFAYPTRLPLRDAGE